MSSTDTLFSSVRRIASVVAVIGLMLLTVLGVRSWLASHDAATQLAATVAAQRQILDQDNAREQQRDAALAQSLAAIAKSEAAVKTPAEAAAQIPDALPSLPAPISIAMPPPEPVSPSTPGEPPEPPPAATATLPQADLQPLYDYLENCRANQEQLTAVQADLADERGKVTALTTERNAAVKASRGGGFWSRVKTGAKWLAIGGAAGAFAVAVSRR